MLKYAVHKSTNGNANFGSTDEPSLKSNYLVLHYFVGNYQSALGKDIKLPKAIFCFWIKLSIY